MFLETIKGYQREISELEKKSAFKFLGLLLLQLELTCLDLNANILFWHDFQFISQTYILSFKYLFSILCATLWRLYLKRLLFSLSRSLQIRSDGYARAREGEDGFCQHLLNDFLVSGTNVLYMHKLFYSSATPWNRWYFYHHFTNKETESQNVWKLAQGQIPSKW